MERGAAPAGGRGAQSGKGEENAMEDVKTAAAPVCGRLEESEVWEGESDFFDCLSHEMKTPITAIKGFAELIQSVELSEEERRQYLQIIIDESSRLAGLVDNVRLLARSGRRDFVIRQKPYPLDEQLRRCLVLLSSAWEQKGLVLSARLEPVTCCGDEELLRHVWLNLLDNAIKYTPEGGRIHVSLAREGDEAVVLVSDSGAGIPEEEQPHIFEKYYQRKGGRTGSGLGLGLSIVRRILDLCGGRVSVCSAAEQGSTFTVRLPINAKPPRRLEG